MLKTEAMNISAAVITDYQEADRQRTGRAQPRCIVKRIKIPLQLFVSTIVI